MIQAILPPLIISLLLGTMFSSVSLANERNNTLENLNNETVYPESVRMRMRPPRLGAAHAISLSTDLNSPYDEAERALILRLGPWLSNDGISNNAQVLIRAIQDAKVHGLNPEAYELSRILRTMDTLAHLDKRAVLNSPEDNSLGLNDERLLRLKMNDLLDRNFIRLARHLGHGVVDGRKVQKRMYRNKPNINPFNLLVSISNAELTVREAMAIVTPSQPGYLRLTRKMRDLLTEKSTRIARTRVAENNEARLISETADKQRLRERFLETGDLSFEDYIAPNTDAMLLKALRHFQSRHGLPQTSFADERTRTAMNNDVDKEIEAVALSLERWRWLPRDFGERHLFVNIPDYRVSVIDNDETTLTMAAVVGKKANQTPSFSRDMSYMEFNPTWTVPRSIANEVLIPRERRNPGHLVSRHFDFLKRVNNRLVKVPPETVTTADLNAARFPYTLRQRGGPINALGRMKFMMPNQYAIYLHDTQAKKHFTLNDRAFSHGCIRLSDPDALAIELLLADGYTERQISQSLNSGKTHRLRFRKPIPTHLVYLTAWVDENNVLQIRPDIYNNDQSLTKALADANTLLSHKSTQSAAL